MAYVRHLCTKLDHFIMCLASSRAEGGLRSPPAPQIGPLYNVSGNELGHFIMCLATSRAESGLRMPPVSQIGPLYNVSGTRLGHFIMCLAPSRAKSDDSYNVSDSRLGLET